MFVTKIGVPYLVGKNSYACNRPRRHKTNPFNTNKDKLVCELHRPSLTHLT